MCRHKELFKIVPGPWRSPSRAPGIGVCVGWILRGMASLSQAGSGHSEDGEVDASPGVGSAALVPPGGRAERAPQVQSGREGAWPGGPGRACFLCMAEERVSPASDAALLTGVSSGPLTLLHAGPRRGPRRSPRRGPRWLRTCREVQPNRISVRSLLHIPLCTCVSQVTGTSSNQYTQTGRDLQTDSTRKC